MRSFAFTAVIGATALAIRGVSGAILPVKADKFDFSHVVKRNALADPTTLTAVLESRSDPNCVWQYQDVSGGQCPQLIRDLNINTLPQLLQECYHYNCFCKRDVDEVETPAQLAERDLDNDVHTDVQSRDVVANCPWQYQDTTGNCPKLISQLNIGNLGQLMDECYHYTCNCKRDVDEAETLANLAKHEPIDKATSIPSESGFPVANPAKRDIATESELETSELEAREAQPDPRKKHHKSPGSYPNCGAPICKLRRALTAIKANKRADTHDVQPSASEKWAMSPDIHGGAGYPHCGAPICVLRRVLFGEREEQRTHPTAKQLGGGDEPAVCGFFCKVRRAVVG